MNKYFKHLGADFASSMVVFLVAIPLCLGVAVASGVNEFSGIIAGAVGGIVVGLISGSQLSVSGPAAGLTAIVAAAILKLPAVEAFFLAVIIAGIFQIIMGVLKLGVIGDYIPNNVIKGMLAAIGIILMLKQLPHLVGYDADFEGDEAFIQASGENSFSSLFHSLNYITPMAVMIGVLGVIILIIYERPWFKKKKIFQIISGPLMVVVSGILLNSLLSAIEVPLTAKDAHLVNVPVAEKMNDFIGFFRFPNWSYLKNLEVWISAFTIAIVATLESLLSVEAVDKLDQEKRVTPANRELVAQGFGNMISGFLGGLPVTSVIVRSSANVNAGAKTKMSAVFHGMLILICVAFIPQVLNLIPKASLAAILVFTGYKLAKVSLFKDYYKKGWEQFIPFVVTVVSIVVTDLLKGVVIGIIVGLFYVIRSNFRKSVLVVNDGDNYMVRLRKDISFFVKPSLKRKLEEIPENANLIIDISHADFIDLDIKETVEEFITHAHLKNIKFIIKSNKSNEHLIKKI